VTERELRLIFRSIVLGLSAPAVINACSPNGNGMDGGQDVTTEDVSDVGTPFGDGGYVDSYVVWCDAGPPKFLTIIPNSCNDLLYVPCGLPPGDYIREAGLAPNQLNRCDQVCKGWQATSCEVLTNGVVDLLLAYLDGGADSAADAGDAGTPTDAGQDPDAIPPLDSPLYVSCDCTSGGRRPAGLEPRTAACRSPLGDYFAGMAHLEAASVPAFARMHAELAGLGAPRALLRRVARSVRDEQRHARVVGRLARSFGGVVEAPRVRRHRTRSVEAMARENVIEGCVRETYGALVASWQAVHARDPRVRRAMRSIARDETRHAAVSASAAAFLASKLAHRALARVEHVRRMAIDELRTATERTPHPALVNVAGVPTVAQSRKLFDRLASALWA
jgi:hypothetical protein